MKKILATLLLLVFVILGGYFGMGLVTEHTLKKNLTALNQANGLAVELSDYHRGLFQSKAEFVWHMQLPEKVIKKTDGRSVIVPPKDYAFEMPLTIHHGPVLFESKRVRFGLGSAHGELVLPEAYAREFSKRFSSESTEPKLALNLFVTYLNKTHLEVDLPAFQLFASRDKSQFDWLGMNSDLNFSSEGTRLQGHVSLDGLRLVGEKIRVILNKVTSSYDVHKSERGLFLGEASLSFPILQVTNQGQTELEIKQLEMKSDSDVDDDHFSSSFYGSFTTLISRGKTYGPGEINVSIQNLDADVLAEINQRANQVPSVSTTGEQAQQLLLSLLPDLPKLLSKGAIFDVSTFNFGLPDGAINGSLHVEFPELDEKVAFQILPKIEGEGHLNIPAPFLKSVLARSFKDKLMRAEFAAATNKSKEVLDDKSLAPSLIKAEPPVADKHVIAQPVETAELDQQAVHQVDQKLADLIQVGALKAEGADYVLDLKLSSGRLLVNGHPFHSGMLSF